MTGRCRTAILAFAQKRRTFVSAALTPPGFPNNVLKRVSVSGVMPERW
jgi:hypothetical protein